MIGMNDPLLKEIKQRFLDGYNPDGTTKHDALTYRADVGYLLGLIDKDGKG